MQEDTQRESNQPGEVRMNWIHFCTHTHTHAHTYIDMYDLTVWGSVPCSRARWQCPGGEHSVLWSMTNLNQSTLRFPSQVCADRATAAQGFQDNNNLVLPRLIGCSSKSSIGRFADMHAGLLLEIIPRKGLRLHPRLFKASLIARATSISS